MLIVFCLWFFMVFEINFLCISTHFSSLQIKFCFIYHTVVFIWVLNVSPYVLGGQSIIIILCIIENLQNVPAENNKNMVFSCCYSDSLESTSSINLCTRG